MDRLIQALKYGGQIGLADWFGQALAAALESNTFDRVLPLPLHTSRLAKRGFNQAAEIARTVCRITAKPLDLDSCRRTRATAPQAGLALKNRDSNVKGAFECVSDLSGHKVLLIDDVMTTGATLNECSRVLKLHGAATVTVGVVARAVLN